MDLFQANHKTKLIDQLNLNNNDFFSPSEIISKLFIDKIINNALRKAHVSSLGKTIAGFNFTSIKNEIASLLAQQFIPIEFEDDETFEDISYSPIVFNNRQIPLTKNSWIEIKEPKNSIIDREVSTFINQIHSKDLPKRISDIAENSSTKNTLSQSRYNTFRFSAINILPEEVNKDKSALLLTIQDKKAKSKAVIDIPMFDLVINNTEPQCPEVENANDLRQYQIEEIKRREIEKKKKIELAFQEKKEEVYKEKKPIKLMDTSKTTFDSKGNIIPLKTIKYETLPNEFYWSKVNIKNIINDDIYNQQGNQSPKRIKAGGNKRRSTVIISNPNSRNIDLFNKKNNNRIDANNHEPLLQPAGSNFDIIMPEIGVRISENKKMKGGSKEFSKAFNKTSTEDYSRILIEHIPSQNMSLLRSKIGSQELTNSLTESTMILNNNSFMGNAVTSFHQKSQSQLLSNPLLAKSDRANTCSNYQSFPSNLSLPFVKSNKTNPFNDDNLKVSSKLKIESVKMAIESLEDIAEYNDLNNINKSKPFNENIFKKSNIGLKDTCTSMDLINKFNITIMRSKTWGIKNDSHPNQSTFIKPSKGNAIRELGLNIMNSKLTRTRKPN